MRTCTFTSRAPYRRATCDRCGIEVDHRGWQAKAAHSHWHLLLALYAIERATRTPERTQP